MKKVAKIAVLIAAVQIAGSPAFANASNGLDIEKAKETASVVRTAPEAFTTRIVEDSNLPSGVEVVVQEGEPGEKTFYKASENLLGTDGGFTSVPILYEEITKLPTQKVIRKGANTLVIDGISEKTKDTEKAKATAAAAEQKKKDDEAADAAAAASDALQSAPSVSRAPVTESASGPVTPAPASGGVTTVEENKAYARSILSPSDFSCTDQLAMRESGWKTTATNPSSGAYGVAQSLPASKMASAGADWRTNGRTQINWMISYMNERYGSPCAALAHSHRVGWY